MAKGARITLTNAQAQSPSGKKLINLILDICHDGIVSMPEFDELYEFLRTDKSEIPAITWLRAITREVIADGSLDAAEMYRLKQAFERVVPKEVRGVISTHLADIGMPSGCFDDEEPAWHHDPATSKQIDFLTSLGGRVSRGMTKGEASKLIDRLLEHRPPSPRQVMLLRFFDRIDLATKTKEEVSEWIDSWYWRNERHELAWERFKRLHNLDKDSLDVSIVPIGAYTRYMGYGPDG